MVHRKEKEFSCDIWRKFLRLYLFSRIHIPWTKYSSVLPRREENVNNSRYSKMDKKGCHRRFGFI